MRTIVEQPPDIQCPICGSPDVDQQNEVRTYAPPFGTPHTYSIEIAHCRSCGERGDFRGNGSKAAAAAIEIADRESLDAILGSLAADGFSMAYIERALRLPARTVARWKTGEYSKAGLALMRIVRAVPWILEVADANFTQRAVSDALLPAAVDALRRRALAAPDLGPERVSPNRAPRAR